MRDCIMKCFKKCTKEENYEILEIIINNMGKTKFLLNCDNVLVNMRVDMTTAFFNSF